MANRILEGYVFESSIPASVLWECQKAYVS